MSVVGARLFFTLFLSAAVVAVGVGALPCGCKPLIRSIRRHRAATTPTIHNMPAAASDRGKFPLVATYDGRNKVGRGEEERGGRADGSLWGSCCYCSSRLRQSHYYSVLLCGVLCAGWVGWGCITSVLLWEEEWPVFVLPVCRPLAQ